MRRSAVRLAVLIAATSVILLGLFLWAYAQLTRPGPLESASVHVIPRGSNLAKIARILDDAGVISDPLIFRYGARIMRRGRALRAGEYEFPAHISARGVIDVLIGGKTVMRRLTVVEGTTTAQILDQVERAEGLEGGITDRPGEGRLMPETYFYSYGDARDELIERMQIAMEKTLGELWGARAHGLPLRTPREALILASIVEKETARPDERARIAAVFHNRLRRGMRLDADPTVVYGLTDGSGPLGRPLTRADLSTDDPYNTYLYPGLPPGPIGNPGRASVAAVLQPVDSEELFFVADGSGGHVFARTLAEHNRNVAKWRRIEMQIKQ